MNKNLIYFICNDYYKKTLLLNLEYLYKNNNNNIDTCCVASKDLIFDDGELRPTYIIYVNGFDCRFTTRFRINEWEIFKKYENFLYLDVDAIPVKNIENIFNIIESNKNILHGVKEINDISVGDHWHRVNRDIQLTGCGYNSGTYGFNKLFTPYFNDFVSYIDLNRTKAECDQPLFNEFFIEKQIIQPTLTNFVFLANTQSIENQKDNNGTLLKDIPIIHFAGCAFSGKNVDYMDSTIKNRLC